VVDALRPRQWIKNLLLFGGLLFTDNLGRLGLVSLALAGFVIFCALSSAVYLVNDVLDRERDLAHPRKCHRPVASGRLSVRLALGVAAFLAVVGVAGSLAVSRWFVVLACGFLALNMAYSFWLKDQVILDVFSIASGFIVRALAGAVAIGVSISSWLLVCTTLLALLLGFGKRRQELTLLDAAVTHRRVLEEYSPGFLDRLINIVTGATLVAYLFYAFQSPTALEHRWIPATIPFVMYGLFRYLYLVDQKDMGGAPEDLVFGDRPLLVTVVGWAIVAALAMMLT
jgi:4-hydroxybenzoate polyprenyltransferase